VGFDGRSTASGAQAVRGRDHSENGSTCPMCSVLRKCASWASFAIRDDFSELRWPDDDQATTCFTSAKRPLRLSMTVACGAQRLWGNMGEAL